MNALIIKTTLLKGIFGSITAMGLVSLLTMTPSNTGDATPTAAKHKIQVALLLDTSNSMDGLIEQAKSRLWNIVNTLTTLRFEGEVPDVEIALYEYGNDGLSKSGNYIKKVTSLTGDLDLVSEKLFSLHTNGGSEYCGAVIGDAVRQLQWYDGHNDMKLIYIAGNEPFDQGPVNYREAIGDARSKGIFVHTILCGGERYDEREGWKNGAYLGKGEFFIIDSDRKVVFIRTPYDIEIERLNIRLNDTYMSYGKEGSHKKAMQQKQDENAASVSSANMAERVVTKSKKVYSNAGWDAVDMYRDNPEAIRELKDEDLPPDLRGKSKKEMDAIILEKQKERDAINEEIGKLSVKRQEFIDKEMAQSGPKEEDDLGFAIENSIMKIAAELGYKK